MTSGALVKSLGHCENNVHLELAGYCVHFLEVPSLLLEFWACRWDFFGIYMGIWYPSTNFHAYVARALPTLTKPSPGSKSNYLKSMMCLFLFYLHWWFACQCVRVSDLLEVELRAIVSCHVGALN